MAKKLRAYFFSGLLVLAPLAVTLYVVWWLFVGIDGLLNRYVTRAIISIFGLQIKLQSIPGLGIITLLLVIILTGVIARHLFGRNVLKISEEILNRIPVVSLIYTTIQQISEAFLANRNNVFQRAALVEFPQKGSYVIGFITQDIKGPIQEAVKTDVYSVFLPTTPNPTSGYLLFVKKKDIKVLDVPIEYAMKMVISGATISATTGAKNKFTVRDSSRHETPLPVIDPESQPD